MAKKQDPAAPAVGEATTALVADAAGQLAVAEQMAAMVAADATSNATGFEEADSSAFAIPFIQILQSGSPQCKRSEGAYIPGAHEGMFFNTVTQDLFEGEDVTDDKTGEVKKGGILLIPCHYTQRFIEWKLRDEGGGFVAEHKPTDPIVLTTTKDEENRDRLPNGNVLVDTRNHYVLHVKPDGTYDPAVVTMSSTQLKKSRNWMSKMQQLKIKVAGKFAVAPMASHMYAAKTVAESNEKGAWMGWAIALAGPVTDPALYQAAQDFRTAIIQGIAKAAPPAPLVSNSSDVGEQF